MSDAEAIRPIKKASKLKTACFIGVTLLLTLGVLFAAQALFSGGEDKTTTRPAVTETADPVKAKYGPNGDTVPDPAGLGPGADATMMDDL